ncbi:protein tyrosine phosphatase [Liquorilactobacillus capillatus DSM 19910]|uniref:Protein tyrosine phosphatase n=1 Tax=Liquorilactobacillus capillatus DSM 19910 TaxID=1423731 RepID=A0A0R1LX02_9LACO|nr:protein tyrosine phosphatase [Liquorilactobacillus capillatus DSM 19910]
MNLRELGGYRTRDGRMIRWQKLLRSGDMSRLSSKAARKLAKYGLDYVIDLRSPFEREMAPDNLPRQTTYRSYPVYPLGNAESSDLPTIDKEDLTDELFEEPYTTMVLSKHSQLAFRMMFTDLLANAKEEHSLLFHCAAGKDRTGIASFLILSALGIDYQVIKRDYLLTNLIFESADKKTLKQKLHGDNLRDLITEMNSSFYVQSQSLDRARQALMTNYGNIRTYMHTAMELSDTDLSDLQRIYLKRDS